MLALQEKGNSILSSLWGRPEDSTYSVLYQVRARFGIPAFQHVVKLSLWARPRRMALTLCCAR